MGTPKEKLKIELKSRTIRENLSEFYNELNKVLIESFAHLKRKPSKARIKKVCKPIFDKWEKVFEGTTKNYVLEMKVPDHLIK
ncbi:MAG TPA: hypothetical protein ENH82_00115, partial [bacterium]|nr:hypothetical protein [bacterium]